MDLHFMDLDVIREDDKNNVLSKEKTRNTFQSIMRLRTSGLT